MFSRYANAPSQSFVGVALQISHCKLQFLPRRTDCLPSSIGQGSTIG